MPRKSLHGADVMARFEQISDHALADGLRIDLAARIQALTAPFDVFGDIGSFHRLATQAVQQRLYSGVL